MYHQRTRSCTYHCYDSERDDQPSGKTLCGVPYLQYDLETYYADANDVYATVVATVFDALNPTAPIFKCGTCALVRLAQARR